MDHYANYSQQPPFGRPPFGRPPFGPPPFDRPPGIPQPPIGLPPVGPPPPIDDFFGPFAVDPGAIRFCLYRFTRIELIDRRRFILFPVFVGPRSVAGWQFWGQRWRFIGIDLNEIIFFSCF
ncbi:hypothetical protein [Alkaliphilus transvaalensis]|uniref:hypothetical protein n=1 Tax=Alkaliphilus transvaalensis TaxID=114628 RepID=UPI00047B4CB5|nr:hypothetical protein [Alkaliphilus transvaalensis]